MGMRIPARFLPGLGLGALDALLAGGLLVAIELQLALSSSPHRLLEASAGLALAACVAVRRRWPLAAIATVAVMLAAQEAAGGRLTQHATGALAAIATLFYGVGALLPERAAWRGLALGLTGVAADVAVGEPSVADLVFPAAFLAVLPWSLGRVVRDRRAGEQAERNRAERLDAEREQRTLSAAVGERTRIARELHDVIAHSVSVMVIQAGGARVVLDSDPQSAQASLLAVERAGREALAEMRRLLGVLGDGSDPHELAPQPGLGDVEELVRRTRAAGLPAELRIEGDPVPVPAALDLCAYRILQEALTNTIKHAGPASAVVEVRWAPRVLELEVRDDGRGASRAGRSHGGHGIAGMRERAALHGGTVRADPGPRGGFAVQARLPLAAEGAG